MGEGTVGQLSGIRGQGAWDKGLARYSKLVFKGANRKGNFRSACGEPFTLTWRRG